MKTELLVMLPLQDNLNTKVQPQWREQNFAFFRAAWAAWIEAAELIESLYPAKKANLLGG